jgi:hypothetical protein
MGRSIKPDRSSYLYVAHNYNHYLHNLNGTIPGNIRRDNVTVNTESYFAVGRYSNFSSLNSI